MSELKTTVGLQSPFAVERTPRLSILHLMLWTLCSAVYLVLIRAIYSLQGDMPSGYATIQDASSVLQGIITGAVFTGAIVLVSTRVRNGPPMLRHPGHWFLVISALVHLVYVPVLLVSMLLMGRSLLWIYGLVFVIPLIAYSVAARRDRTYRCKVLFVALAVMALAQGIHLGAIGFVAGRIGSWFVVLSAIISWGSLLLAGAVVAVSTFARHPASETAASAP